MDSHYTYRVEWSAGSFQYTARCLEIIDLRASAPTAQQALARAAAPCMRTS